MPLPPEVIAAQERMNQAEAALRAYVDGGEHDRDKHRELVGDLQRAIRDYEGRIGGLLQDPVTENASISKIAKVLSRVLVKGHKAGCRCDKCRRAWEKKASGTGRT